MAVDVGQRCLIFNGALTLFTRGLIVSIITVEGGHPTSQRATFLFAWADSDNQGSWCYVYGHYVRNEPFVLTLAPI